jgi:hypothetical protein
MRQRALTSDEEALAHAVEGGHDALRLKDAAQEEGDTGEHRDVEARTTEVAEEEGAGPGAEHEGDIARDDEDVTADGDLVGEGEEDGRIPEVAVEEP